MNHLTEEQLVAVFYEGAPDDAAASHLEMCAVCRKQLQRIRDDLSALDAWRAADRDDSFGAHMWTRIAPHLPASSPAHPKAKRSLLAVLAASLLVASYFGGVRVERQRAAALNRAQERVLLMTVSEHLERSQAILSDLLRSAPQSNDPAGERARARRLFDENRLLRQTALRLGDAYHAAILDDLGRKLLDLANAPPDAASHDRDLLRERMKSDGLLPKMRTVGLDARAKGESL